tara:strand:+ start:236 stop:1045 length:810 start_codon:yes stop_codon:yes gene_type:complete
MKTIGILAKKLNHSLSPIIHNYWANKYKSNLKYKKFEISELKLKKFFQKVKMSKNILGLNITIPYKEQCIIYCDKITNRSKKIGSINFIYKKGKLICGDNTDIIGFSKCFYHLKLSSLRSVLVVGAGGAARSILYFLNKKKICNIDIYTKSLRRKKGILMDFSINNFTNNSIKLKKRYDLIINASSAGMIGKTKLNRNILKLVPKSKGVIDIVYNPLITELINCANKNQIQNIGGLKMLIEQAKPCYEKWANKKIRLDEEIFEMLKSKL